MGRIARLGSIGGILAVALVAHLWMLPSLGGSPHSRGVDAASVTADAADAPLTASCPSGMAACIATGAEELRLELAVVAISGPALLWLRRRRPTSARRRAPSSRHDPRPPLSPVEEGVLLLE